MINVRLHSLANATPDGRALADRAVELLEAVVNDSRFLERVQTGPYSKTWRVTDHSRCQQASHTEVKEIIATGKEFQQPKNETIDLRVALEELEAGVDGVVSLPNLLIRTRARFFAERVEKNDPLSVASLWMHEWMHVAGFFHRPSDTTGDVPWVIGDIVTELGRDLAPATLGAVPLPFDLGFHRWRCPVILEGVPDDASRASTIRGNLECSPRETPLGTSYELHTLLEPS